MISLFFPNEPYLANLFSQAPEVQLLKCVGFHRKSSPADVGAVVERNVLISSATIRRTSGWTEGMVVLKGDIQAGDAGGEGSWSLKDVAYTQVCSMQSLRPHASSSRLTSTFNLLLLVHSSVYSEATAQPSEPRSSVHTRGAGRDMHIKLGVTGARDGLEGRSDDTCC